MAQRFAGSGMAEMLCKSSNMKKYFFINLSLQVIFIFAVIILTSFIPDLYPNFFGDTYCGGKVYISNSSYSGRWFGCLDNGGEHNPTWHWGYRHIMWCLMGVCLFIVQGVRFGFFISEAKK